MVVELGMACRFRVDGMEVAGGIWSDCGMGTASGGSWFEFGSSRARLHSDNPSQSRAAQP